MCETAAESVIVLLTPDLINHEVLGNRNVTGKVNKRSSLYSTSSEKPLPRYLSPPEGSCHDLCKYGKKREFDARKGQSIYLKYSGKRKCSDNRTVVFGTPQNGQGGQGTILKSAPLSESNAPNNSMARKPTGLPFSDGSSDLVVLEESFSMKPGTSPIRQSSSTSRHGGSFLEKGSFEDSASINRTEGNHESINPCKHNLANVGDGSPLETDGTKFESSNIFGYEKSLAWTGICLAGIMPDEPKKVKFFKVVDRQKIVNTKKKLVPSGGHNIIRQNSPSTVEKTVKYVNPKWASRRAVKEASASVSPSAVRKKTISPPTWIQFSSKTPVSLKSKAPAQVFSSTLISSGRAELKRRQDCRIGRNAGSSMLIYAKKLSPQASSLAKPIVDGALCINSRKRPVKMQREAGKVDVVSDNKERTHVVEQKLAIEALMPVKRNPRKMRYDQSSKTSSPKSYITSLESVSSRYKEENEEYESTVNEECEPTISEFSELASSIDSEGRRRRVHSQKDGKSVKQKQRANISPDDKPLPSHKMTFNRGKVISSQKGSTSQRRLRSRQAKAVSGSRNSGGEIGEKSYRKKNDTKGAMLPSPSPETPTAVLRHQDVREKKDARALFNDVIEETAKKLVESRKSKVKALVGAFETVISLHERTA